MGIKGFTVYLLFLEQVGKALRRPNEVMFGRFIDTILNPLHGGRPLYSGKRISLWIILPFPQ